MLLHSFNALVCEDCKAVDSVWLNCELAVLLGKAVKLLKLLRTPVTLICQNIKVFLPLMASCAVKVCARL